MTDDAMAEEAERLREENERLKAEIKAATFQWADQGLREENNRLKLALRRYEEGEQ